MEPDVREIGAEMGQGSEAVAPTGAAVWARCGARDAQWGCHNEPRPEGGRNHGRNSSGPPMRATQCVSSRGVLECAEGHDVREGCAEIEQLKTERGRLHWPRSWSPLGPKCTMFLPK